MRQLRGGVLRALQSSVAFALIGVVLCLFEEVKICRIAGMVLLYYAAASFLFTAAIHLSAYVQLRCARKKELAQKET